MQYNGKPIREWNESDRPREKMMEKGMGALTDAELLAMLLATGSQQHSALDLGRILMDHFGDLGSLSRATPRELMTIHGVGKAKASTIAASFELARRSMALDARKRVLSSSHAAANYLVKKIGDQGREVFYLICLDASNAIVSEMELHSGGYDFVAVDSRLLFKEAILRVASKILVAHNHPSGNVNPSAQDDALTRHLLEMSKAVGIPMLDHIIVTKSSWYSYSDQARLQELAPAGYVLDPKARFRPIKTR
ncbi:MAG: DNA repair protein RadC [Bacteroidia bacterium]